MIRRILLLLGFGLAVSSCRVPEDPCPTPPEQHPQAWRADTVRDQSGQVVGIAWICVGR